MDATFETSPNINRHQQPNDSRPITASPNQFPKLLQPPLVNFVKPSFYRTVNINDGHRPPPADNGHDNLAPARPVAGNVPGERVDVGDNLSGLCCGRGPAHAPAKGNGLAGYVALKGAEDQLRLSLPLGRCRGLLWSLGRLGLGALCERWGGC